jgi:hypothetical protein
MGAARDDACPAYCCDVSALWTAEALPTLADLPESSLLSATSEASPHRRRPAEVEMGLDLGGFEERPDWPKMGPSLLIATCLILAIRTAKRPAIPDSHTSSPDLDAEIDYAAHLAGRTLSRLVSPIFPQRKEPWYGATDEDVPK